MFRKSTTTSFVTTSSSKTRGGAFSMLLSQQQQRLAAPTTRISFTKSTTTTTTSSSSCLLRKPPQPVDSFSSPSLSHQSYSSFSSSSPLRQQRRFATLSASPSVGWRGGIGIGAATHFAAKRFQSSSGSGGTPDHYTTLGVSPTATKEEIKAAYKKKALQWHPDRNKEKGAEDKFKEIGEAYRVLSHEDQRQQYDAQRNFTSGGAGGMGGGPRGFQQPGGMNSGYGGSTYGAPPGAGGFTRTTWSTGPGGQRVVHMSREDADRMFRDAFGGGNLDQIFRDFNRGPGQNGTYTQERIVRDQAGNTYRVRSTLNETSSSSSYSNSSSGYNPNSAEFQRKYQQENPFARASSTNEDAFQRPPRNTAGGGGSSWSGWSSSGAGPSTNSPWGTNPFGYEQQRQQQQNPFGGGGEWSNAYGQQQQHQQQANSGNPFAQNPPGFNWPSFSQGPQMGAGGVPPSPWVILGKFFLGSLALSFALTMLFTLLATHPFIVIFFLIFLLMRRPM